MGLQDVGKVSAELARQYAETQFFIDAGFEYDAITRLIWCGLRRS